MIYLLEDGKSCCIYAGVGGGGGTKDFITAVPYEKYINIHMQ